MLSWELKLGVLYLEHSSIEVHPAFVWNQIVFYYYAVKHVHEQRLAAAHVAVKINTCSICMIVQQLGLARQSCLEILYIAVHSMHLQFQCTHWQHLLRLTSDLASQVLKMLQDMQTI